MGRLPVPQKKAVQLPVFLRKKNGLVPVSHRLFVEVFVSGNKSCLYGYDVPNTSCILSSFLHFVCTVCAVYVEFEEGQDPKAVMKDVLANCKKVEDDCEIYL